MPARVRRLLERGLSIAPAQRWPSLSPLLDALADDPWRRRVRYGVVVGIAGVAAVGAWALGRGQADPCGGVDEHLAQTWDEGRREAVRSHLARAGGQHAEATAYEVAQLLDDYAADWSAEWTDACRAAQVEQRQSAELRDLRDYCLRHRLRALDGTARAILDSEPETGTSWRDAVLRLPSIDRCRDLGSVHDVGQPPADPELRREVERIDSELALARALYYAGHNEAGAQKAREALAEAERLDHPPLLAEAKLALAEALNLLDQADEAERLAFEGMWAADAAQLHGLRVEAIIGLVYNVGVLGGRFEEAEHLAQGGMVLERELVHDPTLRAQLLNHLAAVHATAGDPARAQQEYEQALRIRRDHHLPADLDEGSSLTGIGATALLLGDYERALAVQHEAYALYRDNYGADHPGTLVIHENVATTLLGMERFEEGLAEVEELLQIAHHAGLDDKTIATAEATHGAALLELRRFDEAREALEHSRRSLESPLRRPVLLGVVRGNLALVALEQRRFDDAKAEANAALERLGPLLPEDNLYVVWAKLALARAELGRGEPREALRLASEGWAVLETLEDPIGPDLRSDAALVLARALEDPEVLAEPGVIESLGGGRSSTQWGARALAEARSGGRSAEPMRRRAEAWKRRHGRP